MIQNAQLQKGLFVQDQLKYKQYQHSPKLDLHVHVHLTLVLLLNVLLLWFQDKEVDRQLNLQPIYLQKQQLKLQEKLKP